LLNSPVENTAVRGQAAEALAYISSERSLPCLLEAAQSPVPEVRFWTAFALGSIGNPIAEPVLRELATSDHVQVAGWGKISEEAAAALDKISQARSV
jgi:HEAT repeat protein